MPAAMLALAALQTGYSIYSQNQQVRAANRAMREGQDRSIANQNRLTRQGFNRRREQEGGTLLGGADLQARQNAEAGTILTSTTNNKRSLLG